MDLSATEIARPKTSGSVECEKQIFETPELSRRSKKRRTILSVAIGTLALAIFGFGFWILARRLVPDITAPNAAETEYVASFPAKSIAVLPFRDLDGVKHDVSLADGVQDDILTALSKVADLRVISSTSARSYPAGGERDLRVIAQRLGVAFILEGSVRQTKSKVFVDVTLTDARRGVRVFTQTYARDRADVFGMRGALVQRVAAAVQAQITPPEAAAIDERPTKDIVAYDLYVRGKTIVAGVAFSGQVRDKLLQATQLLEQAIARDPNLYLAYCQLAAADDYLYFFGLDRTPERLAQTAATIQTLERLRPDAGETHLAKATFYYRCYLNYDRARAELALAQRALPNDSEIFELTGYIDRRQNLWNESSRSLQKAFELDPRNYFILQQIASSYQELRQFRPMAAALDRAETLAPHDLDTLVTRALVDLEWKANMQPLHQTIRALLAENPASAPDLADQWFYLALCERDQAAIAKAVAAIPPTGTATDLNFPKPWCEALAARARGDEIAAQKAFLAARFEAEKIVNEQPDYGPALCVLGLIDAGLGRKEQAIREGERARALLPTTKDALDGAEIMKYLGVIYAWCGEKDRAIAQISATLRIPSTLSYGNLKLHPNWDALRGDVRFEKIVVSCAPKTAAK